MRADVAVIVVGTWTGFVGEVEQELVGGARSGAEADLRGLEAVVEIGGLVQSVAEGELVGGAVRGVGDAGGVGRGGAVVGDIGDASGGVVAGLGGEARGVLLGLESSAQVVGVGEVVLEAAGRLVAGKDTPQEVEIGEVGGRNRRPDAGQPGDGIRDGRGWIRAGAGGRIVDFALVAESDRLRRPIGVAGRDGAVASVVAGGGGDVAGVGFGEQIAVVVVDEAGCVALGVGGRDEAAERVVDEGARLRGLAGLGQIAERVVLVGGGVSQPAGIFDDLSELAESVGGVLARLARLVGDDGDVGVVARGGDRSVGMGDAGDASEGIVVGGGPVGGGGADERIRGSVDAAEAVVFLLRSDGAQGAAVLTGFDLAPEAVSERQLSFLPCSASVVF